MIASSSSFEASYSDNSHIFGVPFVVSQYDEAHIFITRNELRQWIDRVINMPIEFHFHFIKGVL